MRKVYLNAEMILLGHKLDPPFSMASLALSHTVAARVAGEQLSAGRPWRGCTHSTGVCMRMSRMWSLKEETCFIIHLCMFKAVMRGVLTGLPAQSERQLPVAGALVLVVGSLRISA